MILKISNAVAAIIEVKDHGILFQERDNKKNIWYPNKLGLFGGGVKDGESSINGLIRELSEELKLELTPKECKYLFNFTFDLNGINIGNYFRKYYLVIISSKKYSKLEVHEGKSLKILNCMEALYNKHIVPYDSFALNLYYNKSSIIE